jgi:hypothetical protein
MHTEKSAAASRFSSPGSTSCDQVEEEVSERDEGAALEEAAVDLVRLDRDERRARARQDRAIRGFIDEAAGGGIAREREDSCDWGVC